MINEITSQQKRDCVKKNYDLIAEQYGMEFGNFIEDLDVYEEFEKNLVKNAKIIDLGAGTGRTYSYFKQLGYEYVGIDFSNEMKDYAFTLHGEFPYILDDMVNLKNHFKSNSIDAVFAVYSLFHLPKEDFYQIFKDVFDILKDDGVFLFSYQIGTGEEMADEPYLKENGKEVLYMNYQTNEEIEELLKLLSFTKIYRKEKIETSESAINSNGVTTVYMVVKKKSI